GLSVEPRMTFALARIGAAFPDAKVIVTGYYPVVSELTRVRELLQFAGRLARAGIEEGEHVVGHLAHLLVDGVEDTLEIAADTRIATLRGLHPLASLVHDL